MNNKFQKTFVFDIDGTICNNTHGKYKNAKPFPDMLRRVNNLYDLGHKIVFMTARGCVSKVDYTEFTKIQLEEWGFKYHELITNKKPHADLFVDDRGENVAIWRTSGKIKGFVASSFDLIHPGYILMLKDAKTVCEHLICAIQVDPSQERENKNKPVQTLQERIMVLEAIRYVDEVVVYNTEQDLIKLLTNINPEIRILGTDYEDKNFTGQNLNIDIYWHKREHNWSTSSLRKRIWQSENEKLV